ncbi:hypothetical protein ACQE3E_08985 [Methylomonas sp. MED-D]|uniref:hypothetical protein n=1 Tax=unclassified Methylomonas TaxID=2608980 RepID=UPI0028A4D2B0|nr:hypothetical protein [Methylomonas sp. MV1]MDT4328957.1 hypothetical protein [Methylomonas sp. MV1]
MHSSHSDTFACRIRRFAALAFQSACTLSANFSGLFDITTAGIKTLKRLSFLDDVDQQWPFFQVIAQNQQASLFVALVIHLDD